MRRITASLPALLLLVVVGTVYALTLLPGVGYHGDTAKFQFVGAVLGTPHATGYPLYLLLNAAFVHLLPFGSLAWKANLLSALLAVAAVGVLQRLLRELGCRASVALATAASFAFTRSFWSQSLVAEVYTFHALLMLTSSLYLLRWHVSRSNRDLLFACAVYAAAFGNHLTSLMLLPSFVFLVGVTNWRVVLEARMVVAVASCIALVALTYGYFLWRTSDPTTPYLEMATPDLRTLWWYLSGAQFQGLMFSFSAGEFVTSRVPLFSSHLSAHYHVLLAVALVGLLAEGRSLRSGFLLLYFLVNAVWAMSYNVSQAELEVYLIPNYLVVAIYLGLGLEWSLGRLGAHAPAWIAALLLLLPAGMLAANLEAVDQSGNTAAARRVEQVLAAVGGRAAILSPGYHESEFFWYYLIGEGVQQARDVYLVHRFEAAQVRGYLCAGRPLRLVEQSRDLPPGLTVYGIKPAHLSALKKVGLRLSSAGPRLYRVECAES